MKQKKPTQKKPTKPVQPPKPERFLLQRTEIGVLVFNEYLEKVKGQKERKLTVLEERQSKDIPKDTPAVKVAEFNGLLPKKSKEAVAGAYESGVDRGRSGIQGGLMNLLGIGGIIPQINQMTSVLNLLDRKVFDQEQRSVLNKKA
jgi:hypothetical protein